MLRSVRAMHGEHYTGEAGPTQEKTYKNPDLTRLPALRPPGRRMCYSCRSWFFRGEYMVNWKEIEKRFASRLDLGRRPVAVTFLDAEPADIPKFSGTEPAG